MINCSIKHKLTLAALVVSSTLSGCASSLDEAAHQLHLNTLIEQADLGENVVGHSEINWWQQFNSTQLNDLVVSALNKNYELKANQLYLQSELAKLGAQKTDYLPQGDLSVATNRNSLAGDITSNSTANASVHWQLDLFGRVAALVKAANASAMSQAEQLRLLKIEVVSGVVKGYINYQGNIKKHLIVTQQIEALEQSIDVLMARVEEGVASELDLNRTKAQLSQQQALLPDIDYDKFRDLSTLALLTGRLTSEISLSDNSQLLATVVNVAIADPSNAIALRPDISQAHFRFSQAHSLSVAASKALLPSISLTGFAGVLGLDNSRLINTKQQWSISPQIEWSLLSYPALLAQRDSQAFLSQAAYDQYQHKVLAAINDSELSLQLLVKHANKQTYSKTRFKHANNAFLQAQAMYQEGQIPYLELLDARQDVLIAQKNNIDASISSLIAKATTYQAFNGRWSLELTNEP